GESGGHPRTRARPAGARRPRRGARLAPGAARADAGRQGIADPQTRDGRAARRERLGPLPGRVLRPPARRRPGPVAGGCPAMKPPFPDFDLPPDKQDALRRARRLEWVSLAFMVTVVAAVGFTAGSSQTMKAMWVEDVVSLIPSATFLIGAYFRRKRPDDR